MAKGRKSGKGTIGHANFSGNKNRRIKKEIHKHTKKMEKLLRLFVEGKERHCKDTKRKIQGIVKDSKRHKAIQSHIEMLKGMV